MKIIRVVWFLPFLTSLQLLYVEAKPDYGYGIKISQQSRTGWGKHVTLPSRYTDLSTIDLPSLLSVRGGYSLIPSGWNPFGYKLTELGETFLKYDGSLDSDVGRFLASLRTRKSRDALKSNWLEVVRVAKTGQSMRVLRLLDDLIVFCLAAGFID